MAQTRSNGQATGASAGDRFYLPNLCTAQSLLFIVVAGVLLSIVFALVNQGLSGFNWADFSLIALFVLWVILVSVAILCKLRPRLTQLTLMTGSFFSYGLILGVTLSFSLLGQWVLVSYFNQLDGMDLWVIMQQVLIAAILAGVSLRYLYLQEQLHIQQQAELSSRIQALQSRIRPHFLFNSMNIIASLIGSDPDLAEKVVEDLSELFRASLSDANQLVPIKQEIELGKNYLHIEGLRLGERLKVKWDIDDSLKNSGTTVQIPHLSLQPLLENAVYHGIQPIADGGTITISLKLEGDFLSLKVINPIPDPDDLKNRPRSKKGNRLALENLQRRLQAYYNNAAKLEAGERSGEKGQVFEVHVTCPVLPDKASGVLSG